MCKKGCWIMVIVAVLQACSASGAVHNEIYGEIKSGVESSRSF